jgi:GT2 family glycosyltransferase
MELAVIIVSWNVKDKLRENLKALFSSVGELDFVVFVVDNNSHDSSAEMVEQEFPNVELVRNPANLGFGKANNQILKEIEAEFALLLNPDMRVESDTLLNMVNWMRENKRATVAGCHLIDGAGETIKHVRRWPGLKDQLAIVLKLPHLFKGVLKNYIRDDFDYTHPAKVDSVRGGFFMINLKRTKDLKHFMSRTLPLFDERYFLWFEEVDYCKQVYRADGEVWYTPTAKCVDLVGQSFKQLPRGQTQKYVRDSMLKYFKKWHSQREYWILRLAWPIGSSMAKIGEKIGINPKAKT